MNNAVNIKRRTTKRQLKNGQNKAYSYFVVDVGGKGKGRFHNFKTKTDAELFAKSKQAEKKKYGKLGVALLEDERADALRAQKLLRGKSSLLDAATFYIKRHLQNPSWFPLEAGNHEGFCKGKWRMLRT